MLPVRVRTVAGWSDACVLNVSSRGLMVHANFSALDAGVVEVWHGDHSITARIVWREGPKAGLQADERIPLDEILSVSPSRLSGEPYRGIERRKHSRRDDASRIAGRIFEFASIAIVAATLAVSFSLWVGSALALPLSKVQAVLHN